MRLRVAVSRSLCPRNDLRARIGRQAVARGDPLRECRRRHSLLRQRRHETLQAVRRQCDAGAAALARNAGSVMSVIPNISIVMRNGIDETTGCEAC
ncbi:hypothetical protein J2785_004115 [Burkholderia ambifaria]|nr:hypothetical protein [Burkholderia ambifaria]MDR6500945.1 hypothetical protein [Burkholderia ambifaria]